MENFKKKLQAMLKQKDRLNLIDNVLDYINTKYPGFLEVDMERPVDYLFFATCVECLIYSNESRTFGTEHIYGHMRAEDVTDLLGVEPITAMAYASFMELTYLGMNEPYDRYHLYATGIKCNYKPGQNLTSIICEALSALKSEMQQPDQTGEKQETSLFGEEEALLSDTLNVPPWV